MTPHIPVETSVTLSVIALAIGLWLLVPKRTRGSAPHELIPGLPLEYPEWAALPLDREEARAVLEQLDALLMDEDLTDEKLREASEGLLPNAADALRSLLGDPLPWGRVADDPGHGPGPEAALMANAISAIEARIAALRERVPQPEREPNGVRAEVRLGTVIAVSNVLLDLMRQGEWEFRWASPEQEAEWCNRVIDAVIGTRPQDPGPTP